ncbi:hypothetical protein D3C73_1029520 [compost metagenome]
MALEGEDVEVGVELVDLECVAVVAEDRVHARPSGATTEGPSVNCSVMPSSSLKPRVTPRVLYLAA